MTERETYIAYLKLKTAEQDWHGVADAAMDLRELDARQGGFADGVQNGRHAAFREVERMAAEQKARA